MAPEVVAVVEILLADLIPEQVCRILHQVLMVDGLK
jgi:hypothetical protein